MIIFRKVNHYMNGYITLWFASWFHKNHTTRLQIHTKAFVIYYKTTVSKQNLNKCGGLPSTGAMCAATCYSRSTIKEVKQFQPISFETDILLACICPLPPLLSRGADDKWAMTDEQRCLPPAPVLWTLRRLPLPAAACQILLLLPQLPSTTNKFKWHFAFFS